MEQDQITAVRYAIEPRTSRFTVRAFASGALSVFGHNPTIGLRELSGDVQFNPDNINYSSLRITVKAASLGVTDDISDKDRREIERQMQEEVLQSSQYPEILYECFHVSAKKTGDNQYAGLLNGDLTLHGITRSQPIPAKIVVNGDILRAFGDFTLNQSDYGIEPVSALAGALKVKDELKFAFDISARKQA